MATDPKAQKLGIEGMKNNVRARDEVGIFCLTEDADCDQMWTEYAGNGTGFVVGFDTAHAGFERLKTPGRLGKVSYSDEPFGSALGSLFNDDAIGSFFRKRMKYTFELEWRSIRFLHRLERCAGGVFLSSFDPASVREIILRSTCAVETDLRQLVAADERYRHVNIIFQN